MVGSEHDIVCPEYIPALYLVCTYMYQVCTIQYLSESCFTGFRGVQRDTNTLVPDEYSVHFHDLYIDGKENAKMTGDRMKMLMLMLPFMVLDLIAPEVLQCMYVLVCIMLTMVRTGLYWCVLGCADQ